MSQLNTVLGERAPVDLGRTLIHEHVAFASPDDEVTVRPADRPAFADRATRVLTGLRREHGLDTLVDATPPNAGRDPELLREVSERSGVDVVCSTGRYPTDAGATPTADELATQFAREVTDGIDDTGVRAGVIKVGTGYGAIRDADRAALRAAAEVQAKTGTPIITHTERGTMAPEQARLLVTYGAEPSRTVVGHVGGNTDPDYHRHTLETGVYVAFDQFGIDGHAPDDAERLRLVRTLVEEGYADRILLSQDYIVNWPGSPRGIDEMLPNWTPTRLFDHVLPELDRTLETDNIAASFLVDNVRRLFGG